MPLNTAELKAKIKELIEDYLRTSVEADIRSFLLEIEGKMRLEFDKILKRYVNTANVKIRKNENRLTIELDLSDFEA